MAVPVARIRVVNTAPLRPERDYVLHWMIGARRLDANFAVERAAEHARALGKPVLVFEALRAGYRWASDRLHSFVLDGMRDNQARLAGTGVGYYCYLERERDAGKGLLAALAARACVVTTDDTPAFFLPAMVDAAGRQLDVRLEAIDGNGLMPLRATDRVFARAQDFRRYLQKNVASHLTHMPLAHPLHDLVPLRATPTLTRWPQATPDDLAGKTLQALPIDHDVPVAELPGGAVRGLANAKHFVRRTLSAYAEGKNHPDDDAASGLSPYLHWGFVGAHQVLALLAEHEDWSADKLGKASGKREGFWRMSAGAEAFLDACITWRELGYNHAAWCADGESFASLPEWARSTLTKHVYDKRPYLYDIDRLASAETDDEVWNAAQRQLTRDGRMHNYLRMLWGKKILEWSRSPEEALATLFELNDRYALDGRDPNSRSGICWVFGRYDRPWAPERPIFGTVRYMSSASAMRKLRMREYLEKYRR